MSYLIVRYPIYGLKNDLLASPGTVLSDEFMMSLAESNKDAPYAVYRLLQYGSVRDDLRKFLSVPPYNSIFGGGEVMTETIKLLEEATLISPLLQILDFFKQHEPYTYRHLLVVFALSVLLAKDLFSQRKNNATIIAASHFHDLGKFSIPLHILNKTSPFTVTERDQMMHHTTAGYVLSSYYLRDHRDITAIVARDHHERLDGSGVPLGVCLQDRLVEIVAVCDVYDALVSSRPYRTVSFDNRSALEIISEMAEKSQISWNCCAGAGSTKPEKENSFSGH